VTNLVDEDTDSPPGNRGWRPGRRTIVISAVVALLVAAALTATGILRHLDGQYGPVESGQFGGLYKV
jgi:hypothetical protein